MASLPRQTLSSRQAQYRATARHDPTPPFPEQIARINDLIRAARTAWFGLLPYLAFVGTTLVGVADADFFLVERQSKLPLVDVTVPTTLFFAFAPLLGMMPHVYLHIYLFRL